jgi:L-rhamnonate dehydratase
VLRKRQWQDRNDETPAYHFSPGKIESFAAMRRSTTIPIASGEHFYGRWEVERYLQAGALSVVQADPEWCGGTSELLRIGTVASLHDAHIALPTGPGFNVQLDPAKIESQTVLKWE